MICIRVTSNRKCELYVQDPSAQIDKPSHSESGGTKSLEIGANAQLRHDLYGPLGERLKP